MKIMKIQEELEEKGWYKSQDGTLIIEVEKNEHYSLAYGELNPGESNKKHSMTMQELYYILEGEGEINVNNTEHKITQGEVIIVPEKAIQTIKNTGKKKLKFLMIVNPPYDPEKEVILE